MVGPSDMKVLSSQYDLRMMKNRDDGGWEDGVKKEAGIQFYKCLRKCPNTGLEPRISWF